MNGRALVCGIIPAYNSRETIAGVVRGVFRHLESVIVADDGSTDGTAEAARQAGAEVIALKENRGKGDALRALFTEAQRRGFTAAMAVDADGQHDADDIPSFLQVHRESPDAIVTGSRMGVRDHIPRHRHNSMIVARYFISLAANQFIEDTQCGFRLYPLSVIGSLSLLKGRYVTETEIVIKAGDSGKEIRCVPIQAHYPPGQPTHFRSISDVAAISIYVISYLMVKWGIEGLRPGVSNTYKGAGTGRDVFCLSPLLDWAFEVLTFTFALPLSVLYLVWYYVARLFSIPALHSLARNGIPVGRLLCSVLLLPVLLILSILDLIAHRLQLPSDLTTGFVHRWYSNPYHPE